MTTDMSGLTPTDLLEAAEELLAVKPKAGDLIGPHAQRTIEAGRLAVQALIDLGWEIIASKSAPS